MEPTNKYLEKIASLSVVGKSWVRDVLPKLTKNSVSALTTANSKAKAFAGNNFHKSILTAPEANRAVKLATGLAAKTVKSQGT
jgi:sulfite reductase alpha subunit-like flavoprotein